MSLRLRLAGAALVGLLAACEPPQPGPRVGEDGRPVGGFGTPQFDAVPTPPPAAVPPGTTQPIAQSVPWDGRIRDVDDPEVVTLPPLP